MGKGTIIFNRLLCAEKQFRFNNANNGDGDNDAVDEYGGN